MERWQCRDQNIKGASDFRLRGVGQLVSTNSAISNDLAVAWLGSIYSLAFAFECGYDIFTSFPGLRRDALLLLGMEPAIA